MTYPTITPLPDAPSRSQSPDDFSSTADAFVAALPDLVTDVNAAGAYIDEKTISVGNDFQGTYSAGTTYTTGQSVLYADLFYLSLVDSNTGNTPDSSASEWVQIVGAAGGGGGGGTVDFTASGSLSNGDLVKINSDGTVSVIQGGGVGTPTAIDSPNVVQSSSVVFDSNSNKIVVVYRDGTNANYGTAVVGTVSGSSISFGTPVVFNSGYTFPRATFDSNSNKVVIAYQNSASSDHGTAIVGTVSGSSISFGTPVVFNSAQSSEVSCGFDSSNNKVVVSYRDGGNLQYGTAIVGDVSGTSISFGTSVVYENERVADYASVVFDSNSNKIVIVYKIFEFPNEGMAVVGTVSGTSISFGTPVEYKSREAETSTATFDSSNNKVVVAYRDGFNSDYGTAIVGTVSGTSISFGLPVVFNSFATNDMSLTFDNNTNKSVLAYRDSSNFGNVRTIGISGDTPTFDNADFFNEAASFEMSTGYDSNSNKAVVVYYDNSDYIGKAVTFSPTDVESWVGFASADATDGATATINVVSSVNEGQSGLTIGSKYYLTNSGTLSTATVDGREVGRAIAADKILITQGSVS